MKNRKNRYEDALEWKDHAVNLSTEKKIISARYGSGFIYRVDGKAYHDFREAVIATEPYNNAAGVLIAIRACWSTARARPFHIYSPKGARLGEYESLKHAASKAKAFEDKFPPLSKEKTERRKNAFLNAEIERKEKAKRRLIEREKAKILAKAQAEKERVEFERKYGQDVGSW